MSELGRVHRHFYHPNSERLYSLTKRGVPGKTSFKVLHDLEKIESTCDLCQRFSHAPHRFRVSLPDKDVVFNRTVCMDIMFLEGNPVLHIVEKDTKFSAAAFLKGETTDETWGTFMRIWVSVSIGFPETIATDQGTRFQSQRCKSLLLVAGIKHQSSGVQSHNALSVGERYHSFLRQIYRKVRQAKPTVAPQNALMLAIKAMNETAGPHGLVPTLLIFGVMPRIPVVPTQLPALILRMEAMHSARKEMSASIAKERLNTSIRTNVPSAAMKDIDVGAEVLVYREKPEKKWTGPFTVLQSDGEVLHIGVKGSPTQVSVDKVKLYLHPPRQNDFENDLRAPQPDFRRAEARREHPVEQSSHPDIIGEIEDVLKTLRDKELEMVTMIPGQTTQFGPESEFLDAPTKTSHSSDAAAHGYLTEVVNTDDPRADSQLFEVAKAEEVNRLRKRRTWRVMLQKDLPERANVLSGRFVLTLKNVGTKEEKAKARYVAQGHRATSRKEKWFTM